MTDTHTPLATVALWVMLAVALIIAVVIIA